jgi:putative transposase
MIYSCSLLLRDRSGIVPRGPTLTGGAIVAISRTDPREIDPSNDGEHTDLAGMAHTYLCVRIHFVWSTCRRHPWIAPEWEQRLYSYFGGIARRKGSVLFCAGGMPDHVHLYLSLPPDISLAQLVSALKANSSRWVHETFPRLRHFAWQQGYYAFSVSKYSEAGLIRYIGDQRKHHSAH